jgi:hypothetical protein
VTAPVSDGPVLTTVFIVPVVVGATGPRTVICWLVPVPLKVT